MLDASVIQPLGEGVDLEGNHVVFDDDGSSDDELYEELVQFYLFYAVIIFN